MNNPGELGGALDGGSLTASDATTAEADALAAHYFPREWSRVSKAPGKSKARQQLRRAARNADKCKALLNAGSRCSNCSAYNTRPIHGLKMPAHCDRQSDFHGYVEARPDEVCADWSPLGGAK